MDAENINQQQQANTIGGNAQAGIPQAQDDPALVINQHYLPRGDLTITSNISYTDSSVVPITIPLVDVPNLFQQTFDNNEYNYSSDDQLQFLLNVFSPSPQVQMPNIARYIGYVVMGIELDIKYQESIMICCQNYLNGTMEILPSGTFRYLNSRRDGLSRRYTPLCHCIYYSISSIYYTTSPSSLEMIREIQSLMQDLYDNKSYTSVYTKVIPYTHNGQNYTISKSMLRRWATTIPWHALIYNSQSPLSLDAFTDLFFKLYSVSQGKVLRYYMSHSNKQQLQTIIPNSDLFFQLTPNGMVSSQVHIPNNIPQRFILFIRYLYLAQANRLPWDDGSNSDHDESDAESDQTNDHSHAESIDDSPLA